MKIGEWNKLSKEEQLEITRKCKESPAYFYNTYFRKEGQREYTDEELLELRRRAMMPLKFKGNYKSMYPLLPQYIKNENSKKEEEEN